MIHLKKEIKKHILKVIIVIILVAIFLVQFEKFNDWIFTQGPDVIKNFFDGLGPISIVLFILVYVVANVLITPSYPFVFIAGIVYGLFGGIVIALIAEVCSATTNFFLGRKFRKTFFRHKVRNKKIKFVKKYVEKHDFGIIFILRYLGLYFDIVSYASGIAKTKYRNFIIATFLGFIPYIFIYVYAGAQLMDIKSSAFIYSILYFKLALFGIFIVAYGIYYLVKRYRKKHANL